MSALFFSLAVVSVFLLIGLLWFLIAFPLRMAFDEWRYITSHYDDENYYPDGKK